MPTPLHNSIIPTVGRIERRFVTSGFLTSNELEDHVTHDFGTDVILTSLRRGTAKKQPDAAFYYIDRSGTSPERDLFPRLVFEVAFSQSYDSVIEDARQWLVRSGGAVQLVVGGVFPPQRRGRRGRRGRRDPRHGGSRERRRRYGKLKLLIRVRNTRGLSTLED